MGRSLVYLAEEAPMPDDAAFRAFVQANGRTLLHAAWLLTGDHQRGEDLVQTPLTKLYFKWNRVSEPLAYVRKAMVTSHVDSSRRRWWGERPAEALADDPQPDQWLTASDTAWRAAKDLLISLINKS